MTAEVQAWYDGRNSIGDEGEVWYSCPHTDPALVEEFKKGVRSIKAELRLNADTEWD